MKYLLLSLVLLVTDWLWKWQFDAFPSGWTKAILDNLNHGLAGCISWLMVRSWKGASLTDRLILAESALSFVIASLVDVDHFVIARSVYLQVSSAMCC